MSYPMRARAGEVLCEIGLPKGRVRGSLIYCPGLPSAPKYPHLLEHLNAEGFIGVALRYRGTWESSGCFLRRSPVEDVRSVLRMLKRGSFTELATGKRVHFNAGPISIIGSSFGGYVALEAMKRLGIERGLLLAPVIRNSEIGNGEYEEEDSTWLRRFILHAFPNVYRPSRGGYERLITDAFGDGYDLRGLEGKQLLIFHSRDDTVININRSRRFVRECREKGVRATLRELRRGHHISLNGKQRALVVRHLHALHGLSP